MFIEQYRLEGNPFAADRVRPSFISDAYRKAATEVAKLVDGRIHLLLVSGPRGVGKTVLVSNELGSREDVNLCWVEAGISDAKALLSHLVRKIGPGPVAGNLDELRGVLQVFLQHQAANGRGSLIVVDGVERDSQKVLNEIQPLAQLRWRKRPVVQIIMTTRNAELANSVRHSHGESLLAKVVHHRLSGFTLDETAAYLRASIQGAGCDWFDEIINPDLLIDIQSFTQGVVSDVDSLCREAFEKLASRAKGTTQQPRLTRALLAEAASKLHLRYDAGPWNVPREETLGPDAIRQSRDGELAIEAAELQVTSGGQVVAEVPLNRPRMVLGRDSSCDISLDSTSVSRYQNLFMGTPEGWMLIDLNSTNGCFVNGRRVHEHRLRDGDLISMGRHEIRFSGAGPAATEAPEPGTERISRVERR